MYVIKVCYLVLKLEVRSRKSLKSKKPTVAKKQPPEFEAEACIFINKETLAQVFSCQSSVIFKNTFLLGKLCVTASGDLKNLFVISRYQYFNLCRFVIFWLAKLISTKNCSLTRNICFRGYGLIRKFSAKSFVMRCHMLISPIISFSVDIIIYAIFDEDLSQDLSARKTHTSYERPKFISR